MNGAASALLVLGMHRSGTSATSGALERLGFALGGRLVPAADDNPKGYFEHEAVVAQHEQFLDALGRHWADPRPFPIDAWQSDAARDARRSLDGVIREDFASCARWALKDPRLSRLLPLWAPLWDGWGVRPHALLVLRRPAEVASSLARRDGFPHVLSDWLWVRHTVEALSAATEMPFTCLDYAALLGGAGGSLGNALRDLGLGVDGIDDATFNGFLDPGMNHHGVQPLSRSGAVSRLADDLFEACLASPSGLAPPDARAFQARIEACWAADGPALEAGMALTGRLIHERSELRRSGYALNSALAAQVRWSDSAVEELTRMREGRERLDAELAEARRLEEVLRRDLAFAEALARAREAERDGLLAERHETAQRLHSLNEQLQSIHASKIWRSMAPIRWLAERLQRTSR